MDDLKFQAGRRPARALVDAEAEVDVAAGVAAEVEPVGVGDGLRSVTASGR